MLKLITRYILLIGFAVFVWGFFLLDVFAPVKDFSELENRYLNQSPALTARAVWTNNYTLRYEEYVNDQFAARDAWIGLKSLSEWALGKLENNGVLYGADNYLFEQAFSLDERQLQRNLEYIGEFSRIYGDAPVTFTIIPNSYAVLPHKLPPGAPVIDQLGIISENYRSLSGGPLKILDIAPALMGCEGEPLYYRTDHHWTTFGAYAAYAAYLASLDVSPVPLDSLAAYEAHDFYGTYYSKAKNWNAVPDTITWYDVPVAEVIIDGRPADGLYDFEMLEKRDKYAMFLHGNNGLSVIRREKTPEHGSDPGKILVFKDSYGNSLVPFLALSFDEVHVVDLRYFDDVAGLLSENNYSELYILYNFTTLTQDTNIYKLLRRDSVDLLHN